MTQNCSNRISESNGLVQLKEIALAWGVGLATNEEIDRIGIVPATRLAVSRALGQLVAAPDHILIDYLKLPESQTPYTPLVKGDRRSLSIAAASILAKSTRDRLLCELDGQYPGYSFAAHKGYGTREHLTALKALGPAPVHRFTFRFSDTGEPISSLRLHPDGPITAGFSRLGDYRRMRAVALFCPSDCDQIPRRESISVLSSIQSGTTSTKPFEWGENICGARKSRSTNVDIG